MTGVAQEKVCFISMSRFFFLMKYALFYMEMCSLIHTDMYKQAHIWDYFHKRKNGLLDPSSNKSLEESSLQMDQDVSI